MSINKSGKRTSRLARLEYTVNNVYSADVAVIMLPPLRYGALSGDSRLTSDVCLSVAQIRPKSRTEAYRKTKIGTKVHVTGTPLSRSKGQRSTCMRRGNIVATSRTACLGC